MKRTALIFWALLISAAFVSGSNIISDTTFQHGALLNCDTLDTNGAGVFACGTDADTHLSVFYPYLYINTSTAGINTSAVQRRVSGVCGVGNSIRVIAEDGSVTCEADSTGSDSQTLVYNTGNDTITISGGNSIDITEVDTTIPDTNETTRMNTIYSWVYTNRSLWDLAYSWGDHSGAGYLTSYTDSNETINVDQTNSWRSNITSACAAGQKLTGFGANGIEVCDKDNNTGGTDTNESARFNQLVGTDCASGQKQIGVGANGGVTCDKDNNTGGTDSNETVNVDQINSYRGNLSGTDCAANQKVTGISAAGLVACDADNDTTIADTNETTRMNTIYTYSLTNRSLWDLAYGWGDHGVAGYLTSYTDTNETTRMNTIYTYSLTNRSLWDTAYSWGNPSGVYQPLEGTLTDIADGTIAENLVNTANPWADDEVVDTITASNYLLLAGGSMTGDINMTTGNVTTVDCIRFENGAEICGV